MCKHNRLINFTICTILKAFTPFKPFRPSVPIRHRLAKLSILILEGIIKNIYYERRDYESVDKEIILGNEKRRKKRIQEVKG